MFKRQTSQESFLSLGRIQHCLLNVSLTLKRETLSPASVPEFGELVFAEQQLILITYISSSQIFFIIDFLSKVKQKCSVPCFKSVSHRRVHTMYRNQDCTERHGEVLAI